MPAPPTQVAEGETTTCTSKVFVSKVRVQGAKASISVSGCGMQQQHATPTTATTDQLRISMGATGVHDAAIIATFIRATSLLPCAALTQVAMSAASCTPC